MKTYYFLLSACLFIAGCKSGSESTDTTEQNSTSGISSILPGLWSIDSAGKLSNEGFLFLPDGTMEYAGNGRTGSWTVGSNDALSMNSANGSAEFTAKTISADQITISNADENYLLRKVLYGENGSEEVLAGYMGSISSDVTFKDYKFPYAAATKGGIRLISQDTLLFFNVSLNGHRLNAAPTREWKGIVITGGEVLIRVESSEKIPAGKSASDFEVKVYRY